jgi:formylmethanofuran dehydrogenase subunit E
MWAIVENMVADANDCPGCGEPMIDPYLVAGYEDLHCRDCARAIEKRRDWLDRRGESV